MCEKIRENLVCPALKLNVCKFVQQRLCFSGDLYFANLSREGLWSSLSSDTSYFANWRQKTAFLDWIEIKKDSFYSSGRGKKCICTWIRKIAVFSQLQFLIFFCQCISKWYIKYQFLSFWSSFKHFHIPLSTKVLWNSIKFF